MKTIRHQVTSCFAGLFLLAAPGFSRAADHFISLVDFWFFDDNGIDYGTAWRAPEFSDFNWNFGISEFGFGDGDEFTPVNPAPNGSPLTTAYFRTSFSVSDPAIYSNVTVRLVRDDGGIVYINGVEIFRSNMPTGLVSYATPAIRDIDGAEESIIAQRVVPASVLSAINTVAVEVHQSAGDSDDLSFALQLIGHRMGENQPPSAHSSFLSVEQNKTGSFAFDATDPDNNPLSFTLVSQPQHGSITGTQPNLIYTPAPEYVGPDVFSFKATDGEWETEIAYVVVDVKFPSNQPPVADAQNLGLSEDGELLINLTAMDPDGDTLTYTFTQALHGTLTPVDGSTLRYVPTANYNGQDGFTFTVDDGNGGTATASINIAIAAVNDLPVAIAKAAPAFAPANFSRKLVIIALNNRDANIILNGLDSADIDGVLTYSWYQETNPKPFSTAAETLVSLPLGSYSFTLVVSDGEAIAHDTITVQVITAGELVKALIFAVQAAPLTPGERNSPLHYLQDALFSFDAGNVAAGLEDLRQFQTRVKDKVQDIALAEALIEQAQTIIDVVKSHYKDPINAKSRRKKR